MCLRAGLDPPFPNHCVRSTTVNILSSKDMKNRHIRAVTGHKSDASLEFYNDRAVQNMSSAITDSSTSADLTIKSPLTRQQKWIVLPWRQYPKQFTQAHPQMSRRTFLFKKTCRPTNAAHGIISGGSFSNCSFNFHFK